MPELSREFLKLCWYFFGVFIFFIIVISFYTNYEHWSISDSIFFAVVTMSTVGYGTPAPTDDKSRVFTIFFILIGIVFVFTGISEFIQTNLRFVKNILCSNTKLQVKEDLVVGDIFHYRKQLFFACLLLTILVIIGASVVKSLEDFSWAEGFYFAIETSSTVGYGDLKIKHNKTKAFLCFYIITSTILIASIIRTYNSTLEEVKQLTTLEEKLLRLKDLSSKDIVNHHDESINKYQLMIKMLAINGVIDEEKDLQPILNKLQSIGCEETLTLKSEQLRKYIAKEKESAEMQYAILQDTKSRSIQEISSGFIEYFLRLTRSQRMHLSQEEKPGISMKSTNSNKSYSSSPSKRNKQSKEKEAMLTFDDIEAIVDESENPIQTNSSLVDDA